MKNKSRAQYWKDRSTTRRQSSEYREQQKQRYKDWYERNKNDPERLKRAAANMRKSAAKHPERVRARRQVRTELESGRMKRLPCEVCREPRTHAHHDDYTQPLVVRWLCRKHHDEHHAKATQP